MRARRLRRLPSASVLAAAALAACSLQDVSSRTGDSSSIVAVGQRAGRAWTAETWKPPVVDSTPDDPLEASVYRGLALVTQTRDSLKAYVVDATDQQIEQAVERVEAMIATAQAGAETIGHPEETPLAQLNHATQQMEEAVERVETV